MYVLFLDEVDAVEVEVTVFDAEVEVLGVGGELYVTEYDGLPPAGFALQLAATVFVAAEDRAVGREVEA